MKRIVSFLLALIIIFSVMLTAVSCSKPDSDPPTGGGGDEGGGGETPGNGNGGDSAIIVPPFKDYGRDTVDFDKIIYRRPDIASTISAFDAVTLAIEKNEKSQNELLDMVYALEAAYNDVLSMSSVANIYLSRDSKSEFWCEEDAYIGQNYPSFSQAVEKLFVAAANSPHAEFFEDEYFGDNLISDYRNGGNYTDELVSLLEDEAALENEYNSLSTATVYITFNGKRDTVDNILAYYEAYYKERYGENNYLDAYNQVVTACDALYYYAAQDAMVPIYVEIVKVRRKIADELSLSSYAECAYDARYHDYTVNEAMSFLNDISTYIAPIYSQLAYSLDSVLVIPPEESIMYTTEDVLLNTLYEVYGGMDAELSDIYNYMLQHKLYDVAYKTDNRVDGAFTTYINGNNSPFVFATIKHNLYDYATLSHEFGHFADYYINYGATTSLDLSEVYSTALEYLTLTEMKNTIPDSALRYLLYYQIDTAFQVLLTQGFYAMFEHEVYALEYDEITEKNISDIALSVGTKFSLNPLAVSDLSNIMIRHLVEVPFYVQSYCTSMAVALQIYIMDTKDAGAGLKAYKTLLHRPSNDMEFDEILELADLDSPFEKYVLRDVSNEIYRIVTGRYYYQVTQDDTNAA